MARRLQRNSAMRELCPRRTRSVSLCEALDRVLNTGVVALGEIKLSVADVDLVYLGLQLVVTSIESGRELAPVHAPPQSGPPSIGAFDEKDALVAGDAEQKPSSPGVATARCDVPTPQRAIPAIEELGPAPSAGAMAGAMAGAGSNRDKNGLGKLVLTLLKAIHELLKRQAIRRIAGGSLGPAQIEGLGAALMNQAREIERLRHDFGLNDEDLNLDLGPLGKLL